MSASNKTTLPKTGWSLIRRLRRGFLCGAVGIIVSSPVEAADPLFLPPLATGADPAVTFIGVRPFQMRAAVESMAWNDSENEILVGLEDSDRVVAISATTGMPRCEFRLGIWPWDIAAKKGLIAGIEQSKDGTRKLVVMKLKTGERMWEIPIGSAAIRFSTNSEYLLVAHDVDDVPHVEVFDSLSGKSVRKAAISLPIKNLQIAMKDDSHVLLATSFSSNLWILDLGTGEEVAQKPLFEDEESPSPGLLRLSRDGQFVATIMPGQCVVWRIEDGKRPKKIVDREPKDDEGAFESVTFSDFAPRCVISLWNTAEIIDLTTGRILGHAPDGGQAAALNGDGTRVAVACGSDIRINPSGKESARSSFPSNFQVIALQPKGGLVAAGGGGDILLWNAATGAQEAQIKNPGGMLSTLAFSPNGKGLYFSDGTGIWVQDLSALTRAPKRVFHWDGASSDPEFAFDFSHDGKAMVVMRNRKAFFVELGKTFEEIPPRFHEIPRDNDHYVKSLRISPDDRELLIVTDSTRELFDLDSNSLLARGEIDAIQPVAISKDGSKVLVDGYGPEDDPAILNSKTGKPEWVIPLTSVIGKNVAVGALALDSQNGLAAFSYSTGTRDNFGVVILDTANQRVNKIFLCQHGHVKQLTFAEDGKKLFGVNADSSIAVMPTASDRQAAP